MYTRLIEELKSENLCTHFVLPLLKLNKFNFTSSNFINCYLTEDGLKLIVHIVDKTLVSQKALKHKYANGVFNGPEATMYMCYSIPHQWRPDISLFMRGQFSKMSQHAKEFIVRYSNLEYKRRNNGGVFTDAKLLALDKHPVLKDMWERLCSAITGSQRSIVELGEDAELLSIPGKESYISPDGLVRI